MGVVVEREALELLGDFLRETLASPVNAASAGELEALGAGAGRDVWISRRPLSHPVEAALARWAIFTGAVVLVEPGPSLHPELFAWARPTLVTASVDELIQLADQLTSLSPRFLHRRWLRQRLERLRWLLVDSASGANEVERVEDRWRELSVHFKARVAPFPV